MAKQANTMMIGGFVVIAVFLLAISIVLFGSGKFFKQTEEFVLHFDTSIKGLSVGAPVLFNGVMVGTVTKIIMVSDHDKLEYTTPVYVEIEPDRVQIMDGSERLDPYDMLPRLIDKGLRGVLTLQSLITGQLMIELGYHPDTPVSLKHSTERVPEIPTIQSTTERLFQILQQSDFKGMLNNLENALSGIDSLVNNQELTDIFHSIRLAADNVKDVSGKINTHVDPLAQKIDDTLTDSRKLINNLDHQLEPIGDDLKKTFGDFDKLILTANADLASLTDSIEKSLADFRGIASEDSPLIIKVEETLQNISAMVSSLQQLADYLERHPESLFRGKGK